MGWVSTLEASVLINSGSSGLKKTKTQTDRNPGTVTSSMVFSQIISNPSFF